MATTYGEQMLARAEARVHRRSARRRLFLLVPGAATVLWSLWDLLGVRFDRLDDAGLIRIVTDPILPASWTILFVFLPLIAGLKRDPLPAGLVLAVVAGPIMTPMLFGPGGWLAWQLAMMALIATLALGAAVERRRRFPD